ncbi:MAG: hypothetical protein V2B16_03545 [bacterium]
MKKINLTLDSSLKLSVIIPINPINDKQIIGLIKNNDINPYNDGNNSVDVLIDKLTGIIYKFIIKIKAITVIIDIKYPKIVIEIDLPNQIVLKSNGVAKRECNVLVIFSFANKL